MEDFLDQPASLASPGRLVCHTAPTLEYNNSSLLSAWEQRNYAYTHKGLRKNVWKNLYTWVLPKGKAIIHST